MTYFEDEVGTIVTYATGATNIGATADFVLFVEKPSGATTNWTLATGELNLTTGVVTHTLASGELPDIGEYKLQGRENKTGATPVYRFFPIDRIVVHRRIVP